MAELWADLVYPEVLQSDGFNVDYAVLTTYSLDMPSLLGVPFTLGTMADLTDAAMRSPHLLLEAVNRAADRFAVFCNAGCIAVPQAASKVYALLERSVVQIELPAAGAGFVNFHPKVWVVRETNPDTAQAQIKVVVLSRNLTGSADLDVACELVGRIGTELSSPAALAKHRPLADFLAWLADRSPARTRRNIRGIIDDLHRVERFDLSGSPFDDYDFFPTGIDGYNGVQCLNDEMLRHAAEMVIISPFIDEKTLTAMTACRHSARKTLITRHASVTAGALALFGGNDGVYVPKEVLTDRVEKDVAVDLHEKVYFIRNGRTGINHLYLGSANATQNGFKRNVEFLLRLSFAPYKMSYDRFRSELIHDGKSCMFERITAAPAGNGAEEDTADEQALRRAIAAIQKAEVRRRPDGDGYDVTVRSRRSMLPAQEVTLHPLGCDALGCTLGAEVVFDRLTAAMLTEFYVLAVGGIRRVVKIDTSGIPVEERDRAIFRSLIDTPAKFISYLSFMLTDDVEQFMLEDRELEKELGAHGSSAAEEKTSVSLYEDMVRTAYTDPDRIAAIRSIIDKADSTVIPEHFGRLYESFEKAVKRIRRL